MLVHVGCKGKQMNAMEGQMKQPGLSCKDIEPATSIDVEDDEEVGTVEDQYQAAPTQYHLPPRYIQCISSYQIQTDEEG